MLKDPSLFRRSRRRARDSPAGVPGMLHPGARAACNPSGVGFLCSRGAEGVNRRLVALIPGMVEMVTRTPDPARSQRSNGSLIRAVIAVLRLQAGRAPSKGSFLNGGFS